MIEVLRKMPEEELSKFLESLMVTRQNNPECEATKQLIESTMKILAVKKAAKILEEKLQAEGWDISEVEYWEETDKGMVFTGTDWNVEHAEILVTKTNHVFVNGDETDVYLPFNVWSL